MIVSKEKVNAIKERLFNNIDKLNIVKRVLSRINKENVDKLKTHYYLELSDPPIIFVRVYVRPIIRYFETNYSSDSWKNEKNIKTIYNCSDRR